MILLSCTQRDKVYEKEIKSLILLNNEGYVKEMMKKEEYNKAKILLDSLIRINSSEPFFYVERGKCNTFLMFHEEAILDFQKSLSMNNEVNLSIEMIKLNREAIKINDENN